MNLFEIWGTVVQFQILLSCFLYAENMFFHCVKIAKERKGYLFLIKKMFKVFLSVLKTSDQQPNDLQFMLIKSTTINNHLTLVVSILFWLGKRKKKILFLCVCDFAVLTIY